jgi:hypothetical protein
MPSSAAISASSGVRCSRSSSRRRLARWRAGRGAAGGSPSRGCGSRRGWRPGSGSRRSGRTGRRSRGRSGGPRRPGRRRRRRAARRGRRGAGSGRRAGGRRGRRGGGTPRRSSEGRGPRPARSPPRARGTPPRGGPAPRGASMPIRIWSPAHLEHGDHDLVADDDRLAEPSGQDQHGVRLLWARRRAAAGPRRAGSPGGRPGRRVGDEGGSEVDDQLVGVVVGDHRAEQRPPRWGPRSEDRRRRSPAGPGRSPGRTARGGDHDRQLRVLDAGQQLEGPVVGQVLSRKRVAPGKPGMPSRSAGPVGVRNRLVVSRSAVGILHRWWRA